MWPCLVYLTNAVKVVTRCAEYARKDVHCVVLMLGNAALCSGEGFTCCVCSVGLYLHVSVFVVCLLNLRYPSVVRPCLILRIVG